MQDVTRLAECIVYKLIRIDQAVRDKGTRVSLIYH